MLDQEPVVDSEGVAHYPAEPEGLLLMSSLQGWDFAEGEPNICGWTVLDDDNDPVGEVDDLLVDAQAGRVVMAIVAYDNSKTAIPLDHLDIDEDDAVVRFLGEESEIRNAPHYEEGQTEFDYVFDYWYRTQSA